MGTEAHRRSYFTRFDGAAGTQQHAVKIAATTENPSRNLALYCVREFREGLQTSGGQHDEVRTGFGFITRFTGYAWPEQRRTMRSDAVVHQSVYRRFDLKAVQVYDVMIPYRPATLGTHKDFEAYYKQGAPFPADSLETGTEMAGEPPKTTPGQTLAAGTAQ